MIIINNYVWLSLGLILVSVEALYPRVISIWFALGSLAAFGAYMAGWNVGIQFAVFGVVSLVFYFSTRSLVRRYLNRTGDRNTSSIGSSATALSQLEPGISGRVALDGVDWPAETTGALNKGDICTVIDIKGSTLIVSPKA